MGVSKNRPGTHKRKAPRSAFVKGDPRINRKGRPRLSEEQRRFREDLHDMRPAILQAVEYLVTVRDATVVNKLIEKLSGKDPEELTIKDERPDLSKLTTEQLREWKRLAGLARGDGSGSGQGTG